MKLFIPDRIKVGFQKREGTYTKKLAYVIYFDKKGVLRKETSWNDWRDHEIKPAEFDNIPTDGFVLNKGVGGGRASYSWNHRNEYIRVFDPRDFEFEISVANLLFILRECDCNKGKGLEGKFVYAWDRTELVLLPAISEDYQESQKFTDLQDKTIKAKELIPGASYTTKQMKTLVYVGRFDYYFIVNKASYRCKESDASGVFKRHVFWDGENFVYLSDMKSLAVCQSDTIVPNYAELVDKYNKSRHGSRVVELYLKEKKSEKEPIDHWYMADGFGGFKSYSARYNWKDPAQIESIHVSSRYFLKDGIFQREDCSGGISRDGKPVDRHGYYYGHQPIIPWVDPVNRDLYARLESGSEFSLSKVWFDKE